MQDFKKLIQAELDSRGWTVYRLNKQLAGKLSPQTIYNLLNGKPVQAATIAAVFEALGFVVTKKGAK